MLYDDCLPTILAQVEGCPRIVARDALRNACIEFCEESRWLTTGSQVVLDGTQVPNADLTVQVLDILEASIDGEPVLVTHMNDEAVDELQPGEYAIRFADPNNPVLTPAATPSAPVTVDLLLCIAPGPESTEMQVDLWRRWSEGLKSGALKRLLSQPKKLWTDIQSASIHADIFKAAIDRATVEASRNRKQPGRRLRVKAI